VQYLKFPGVDSSLPGPYEAPASFDASWLVNSWQGSSDVGTAVGSGVPAGADSLGAVAVGVAVGDSAGDATADAGAIGGAELDGGGGEPLPVAAHPASSATPSRANRLNPASEERAWSVAAVMMHSPQKLLVPQPESHPRPAPER
jgi:hypothetical protein